MAKINIGYNVSDHDLSLKIGNLRGHYAVQHPQKVLACFSEKDRQILAENFIYSRLRNLSFLRAEDLFFNFSQPFLKDFVDWGIKNDLARISDANKIATDKLVNGFKLSEKRILFNKKSSSQSCLSHWSSNKKKAVLALSFGKDSLLTYGLAREIGLEVLPVFVREMPRVCKVEQNLKHKIIDDFVQKEKVELDFLSDNVDEVYYRQKAKRKFKELDNSNGMLAFCLEALPFVKYHQAKYLLFGNEQNLNDPYINDYGVKAFPSFDQTSIYSQKLNKLLKTFTNNSFSIVSLVEGLYNIAEMKILINRYPHLLQYVMSCDPENNSKEKWCYNCTTCAESFLYTKAMAGNASVIGFNKNFFENKYRYLYPLFHRKSQWFYDKPREIKEGEMLAFLIALKNGEKGDLIAAFKKKFLKEALAKEGYLRRKYFSIHKMPNVPQELQVKLIKIFNQELK